MNTAANEIKDYLARIKEYDASDIYAEKENVDALVRGAIQKVVNYAPDTTTEAGRDECASIAYNIARIKTTIDEKGKEVTEKHRIIINNVDAIRRDARERLDAAKANVRKPLDDYERAEKQRTDELASRCARLEACANLPYDLSAHDIESYMQQASALYQHDWQEYADRAQVIYEEKVMPVLRNALQARQKYEADQAELERLRAMEQQRLQNETAQFAQSDHAESQKPNHAAADWEKQKNDTYFALSNPAPDDTFYNYQAQQANDKRDARRIIIVALMERGLSEDQAASLYAAMAAGEIPHVRIVAD